MNRIKNESKSLLEENYVFSKEIHEDLTQLNLTKDLLAGVKVNYCSFQGKFCKKFQIKNMKIRIVLSENWVSGLSSLDHANELRCSVSRSELDTHTSLPFL